MDDSADMFWRSMAVIGPAISHPEVIIAAVAARDEKKAQAYAKKHGIPIVLKSYQGPLTCLRNTNDQPGWSC
jgi:predicted dehydrogenase